MPDPRRRFRLVVLKLSSHQLRMFLVDPYEDSISGRFSAPFLLGIPLSRDACWDEATRDLGALRLVEQGYREDLARSGFFVLPGFLWVNARLQRLGPDGKPVSVDASPLEDDNSVLEPECA